MGLPADDRGHCSAALCGLRAKCCEAKSCGTKSSEAKPSEQRRRGRHVVGGAKLLLQIGQPAREPLGRFPISIQWQEEVGDVAQLLQGEPQPVSLLRGERLEVTAA